MNLLIIGGTRFLGRHLVDSALARGHQITLFNRGKTDPNLFPQLETILGDRDHDIEKLSSRTWDAVIDTCGYVPRIVRESSGSGCGGMAAAERRRGPRVPGSYVGMTGAII
jgi:2'-hydroxyisoflavone reductase